MCIKIASLGHALPGDYFFFAFSKITLTLYKVGFTSLNTANPKLIDIREPWLNRPSQQKALNDVWLLTFC